MLEDDDRRSAAERLALYAFVGLVVALLIVMGHNVRTANQRADRLIAELSTEQQAHARAEALVSQLTTETNLLMVERHKLMVQIDELSAPPAPSRLIVRLDLDQTHFLEPCEDRPTPVFPRDSQFPAK